MRVENWNPNAMDETFENVAVERLVQGAEVVKRHVSRRCPVGTVSRPIYQSGPYAGKPWTSRDRGRLKRSIRIARKKTKSGKAFTKKRNVRVYAGSYPPGIKDEDNAYYAGIVEHTKPYMRPGLASALPAVKTIIGVK